MFNTVENSLLGLYDSKPELLEERVNVEKYYNFYYGKAKNSHILTLTDPVTTGQSWVQPEGLDYEPSQDVRNHTKKLIHKQARFMFGAKPDILMKPFNIGDKDKAEAKRMVLDEILEDAEFWGKTAKAFLDCTIGKRVLLLVTANPKEPIKFTYYPMQQFTYKVDPNDCTKLTQVIIAYQDKETLTEPLDKQKWHKWRYYMNNNKCWVESGIYDGNCHPIEAIENRDTGLDELPCRVILNGGLTGDIMGTSDIEELMDLATAYNKTTSDFRDALRFRMFEQPVFIDADTDSIASVKIAPNALVDLKTDPTSEGTKADAKMLSSTFAFTEAVNSYLEGVKTDMYELYDQPRPEQLANVPSAKALKFMFYDLMARCDEKWLEWEPAIKWLVKFVTKCCVQWNLYPEYSASTALNIPTSLVVKHNYPVPEDEEVKKDIAIKEVQANVRSHKSYIRDLSDIEDEDIEWEEILAEQTEVTGATQDQFSTGVGMEMGGTKTPPKAGKGDKGATGGTGKGDKTSGKGDKTNNKE